MRFERITVDAGVCTGKPCIRGMRFPVSRLLGLLAAGTSWEDVLREYPYLEQEDIREVLRFAASLAGTSSLTDTTRGLGRLLPC